MLRQDCGSILEHDSFPSLATKTNLQWLHMQQRKHGHMPTDNNGIFEKFNTQDICNLLKRNACSPIQGIVDP